jgi:hypothetical protein
VAGVLLDAAIDNTGYRTVGSLSLSPASSGDYLIFGKGYAENTSEFSYITVFCELMATQHDGTGAVTGVPQMLDFSELRPFYVDLAGGVSAPQALVAQGSLSVTGGSTWVVDLRCRVDQTAPAIVRSLKLAAVKATLLP